MERLQELVEKLLRALIDWRPDEWTSFNDESAFKALIVGVLIAAAISLVLRFLKQGYGRWVARASIFVVAAIFFGGQAFPKVHAAWQSGLVLGVFILAIYLALIKLIDVGGSYLAAANSKPGKSHS